MFDDNLKDGIIHFGLAQKENINRLLEELCEMAGNSPLERMKRLRNQENYEKENNIRISKKTTIRRNNDTHRVK